MASFAESTYLRGVNGSVAAVDTGNLLRINPKSDFQRAVEDGRAFAWAAVDENQDIGDTLLALENNSTEFLLCIQTIAISIAAAGGSVCPVFTAKGITVAGSTAVVGTNLNRNSAFSCVPLCTCVTEETGNGEAASSWPYRMYMPQVLTTTPYIINVDGAIRLPYDHMLGVDSIQEPTSEAVTFIGWFEPI